MKLVKIIDGMFTDNVHVEHASYLGYNMVRYKMVSYLFPCQQVCYLVTAAGGLPLHK